MCAHKCWTLKLARNEQLFPIYIQGLRVSLPGLHPNTRPIKAPHFLQPKARQGLFFSRHLRAPSRRRSAKPIDPCLQRMRVNGQNITTLQSRGEIWWLMINKNEPPQRNSKTQGNRGAANKKYGYVRCLLLLSRGKHGLHVWTTSACPPPPH